MIEQNLAFFLGRAARLFGSRTAVTCQGRSWTYFEFAARAGGLAAALHGRGARRGAAVAMLHRNCHHVLEAYFAAAELGALFVPLNIRLAAGEIAAVLADCQATILLAEPCLAPAAHEALASCAAPARPVLVLVPEIEAEVRDRAGVATAATSEARAAAPDDPAQLYYTSGSTGAPKGVILTHGNVAAHALAAVEELGITAADVWLHAAPLFHLADAWATFAVTWAGGRHVLLPDFEPAAVLEAIASAKVTITNLVPAMLNRIVHQRGAIPSQLASMRRILSGGAPMAPELQSRIEALFPCEYVQTYGLTETSPFLTFSLLDDDLRALPLAEQRRYRGMTGRPMKGVEVAVVDACGRAVPRDGKTVGEIVARGPTVSPGYFRRPEETAAAFRDGWLHTGDLARVDPRGFLNIVDRIKDVINTGGETVYSIEVENALFEHPGIREAAVFAVPDEEWGEAVRAAVVFRDGAQPDLNELRAFCRSRLSGFKIPRSFDVLASLPRTGSGKIDKKTLREPSWRGREKRVN